MKSFLFQITFNFNMLQFKRSERYDLYQLLVESQQKGGATQNQVSFG